MDSGYVYSRFDTCGIRETTTLKFCVYNLTNHAIVISSDLAIKTRFKALSAANVDEEIYNKQEDSLSFRIQMDTPEIAFCRLEAGELKTLRACRSKLQDVANYNMTFLCRFKIITEERSLTVLKTLHLRKVEMVEFCSKGR
jgi:hypothetical protein